MTDKPQTAVCDLHTHSTFSDGTLTPTQLVSLAKEISLGAIALTDHNTTHGLPEFLGAARKQGVKCIPGSEISTTYDGHEAHMLALFIPEDRFSDVDDFVRVLWTSKEKSNISLCDALTQAGYPIDYEKVKAATPSGQVNRSRIADALVDKGYMSKEEAFQSVLRPRDKGGLFEPPIRPATLDTIRFIRSIGAVPVLAHPFLNFTPQQLEEFLPKAKDAGLVGMEEMYSEFSKEQTAMAARLNREYGLLPSGGSDFHGAAKKGISLGYGKGGLRVPMSFEMTLDQAAREIQKEAERG